MEALTAVLDNGLRIHFSDADFLAGMLTVELPSFHAHEVALPTLAAEFLVFAQARGVYDQVRLLNPDGMEVIRVNKRGAHYQLAPSAQLQDKSARRYFIKGKSTKHNIYVSAFDLNQENNALEKPYKPVLRIASPVKSLQGAPLGVIVLNFLGETLLKSIRMAAREAHGSYMLLNPRGDFLVGLNTEDEFSALKGGEGKTMPQLFPAAWEQIKESETGQFSTPAGLFTYQTLLTDSAAGNAPFGKKQFEADETWTLVSLVRNEALTPNWELMSLVSWFVAYLILIILLWVWTKARVRNEEISKDIQERERLFRTVANSTHDAIVMTDAHGVALLWNKTAEEMFGYSQDEVLGRDVHSFMAIDEDFALIKKGLQSFAMTGKGPVINTLRKITAQKKGGGVFPAEISVAPLYQDGAWKAVGIIRDISFRVDSEKKLQEANARLEQRVKERTQELAQTNAALRSEVEERKLIALDLTRAKEEAEAGNRAKSEFLATMSHEIRTPLNAIINMSELVRMGALDTEQREYTDLVIHSGRHLLALINSILDISKAEAGKIILETVDFDLVETLHTVISSLSPLAQEKGLYLNLRIDEHLHRRLNGDPHRLQQILLNLIGNAVKFTEHGGVTVTVSCAGDACVLPESDSSQAGRVQASFSIRDTGIGVTEEQQEHIFDLFSQGESSTNRKYGGAGLGLAITRRLVDMMGGEIHVKSRPGEGAEFSFTVFFDPGVSHEIQRAPEVSGDGGPDSPLRVLLVEDDEKNIIAAQTLLSKLGHTSEVARNGAEALELLTGARFDTVLMDVEMSVMNGLEATQRIRAGDAGEASRDVRIIALTAHATPGYREKCVTAGMNSFLSKPFSLTELAQHLGDAGGDVLQPSPPQDQASELNSLQTLNKKAALKRFGQDVELYDEICADFLGMQDGVLREMKKHAKNGATGELSLLAHSLKSNCGAVGADKCQEMASRLEQKCRTERCDGFEDDLAALEAELVRLQDALS